MRGFEPIPVDLYWEKKRNRVDRRALLSLSHAAGIYDEFLAAWLSMIETRESLALDRLQTGVVEILERWKLRGVKLLLATMRNHTANLHWQLGELGIVRLFDRIVVVGSAEAGANKSAEIGPHLERSRLDEVVWVGDTEVDIQAARDLGVKICAVTCGLRTSEYLASLHPDMLKANLTDFAENGFNDL